MRALWALCCVCVIACDGSGSGEAQQAGGSGPPICTIVTPHMPWPQVTNPNNRHVLMPPHLITVAPSNFRGPGEFKAITEFVATLVNDNWLFQIAEDYVIDPFLQLRPGTHDEFVGDPLVIPCAPCIHPPFCQICPRQLTQLQVEQYIEAQMSKHPEIATSNNDIYIVLFPRNVNVPFSATRGVATFHADFSELGGELLARDSAWEAIQHNEELFDPDQYTLTISHETAEAITDTGSAWALRFDPSAPVTTQSPWNAIGNEIGDLCAGAQTLITGVFGTYVVERPLSNSHAAAGGDPCFPTGPATYFNTTIPTMVNLPVSEWTLAASKTVTIPIRGWIDGADCTVRWSISAAPQTFKGTPSKSFTPTFAKLDKTTLSNGEDATLTVKIPPHSKAGSFGVVRVRSTPMMMPVPRGTDTSNDAYYGIFVPNDL